MLVQRQMHEALLAGEMAHYTIEKRYRAGRRHARAGRGDRVPRPRRAWPPRLPAVPDPRHLRAAPHRRGARPPRPLQRGRRGARPDRAGRGRHERARRAAGGGRRRAARRGHLPDHRGRRSGAALPRGPRRRIGRSQGERWTMRERSLAGLVFGTDGPLVVEDLANSELDASAGLLASGMRSTMGVSVEGRDGPAGMVAVFSREQRAWSARGVVVPARRRQRHGLGDRALDARGGRRPPRAARPADRAAEPRPVRRPAGAHARPRAPRRPAAGGADRRPRPVQADQRLARPPGRRRAAVRGRAAARRRGAGHGHGRALRRRRVRRAVRRRGRASSRRSSSPSGSPPSSTSRSRSAAAPVYISASFGVAYAGPDSDAEGLLRDADAALYRAKARGRGRCELFDAPMRAQAMARLEIETGLRVALGTDQLACTTSRWSTSRAARRWRSRR